MQFVQGDTKTDYFYFVMDGEVRFTIRDESGEEQEIKVGLQDLKFKSNESLGQMRSIST